MKRTIQKQALKPVQVTNLQIYKMIIKKDEYAIGALSILYGLSVAGKINKKRTKCKTVGVGFNGVDFPFLSSIHEQYKTKGRLTDKQFAALKKLLVKYHKQVKVIFPMPVKVIESKRVSSKTCTATLTNKVITLDFPYSPQTVSCVKMISGRKWNKDKKQWTCPLSIGNVMDIMNLPERFQPCLKLRDWFLHNLTPPKQLDSAIVVPGLKATLKPYQSEGVSFIDNRDGNALIGDEMGLGKTIQALAWLQLRKSTALPAIVVVPASLKLNWAREALKFTELEPVIVNGRDKKSFVSFPGCTKKDLYIANYDILFTTKECVECEGKGKIGAIKCKECGGKGKITHLHKDIAALGIKTVVFDECQKLSNSKAGRTIAGKELSAIAENVIGLSGTPINNRTLEFYNIIQMIDNTLFPSWWDYTKRYCDRKQGVFGMDVSGASNTKELHKRLTDSIMIRRLKKNVLAQLPDKVRSVVPIEINLNKYNKIVDKAKAELEASKTKAQHLTIIERAKQAVVALKMKLSIEWIKDYTEDNKLVVFAEHKVVVEQLEKAFGKLAVTVSGKTSQAARQAAVDRFQTDPECKIFIGSESAKEGLTLTAASATCFLELWWLSTDHDQAEDRVHRIGQEADSVSAYYLLAAGTIEEDIAFMLDEKRKVITAVLDGEDVEEKSMLVSLMNKISGKEN